MDLREELLSNRDLKYRDFHSALVPNLDKDKIIGVRVPVMRSIAKRYSEYGYVDFDSCYYEELMIKGLIIGYEKCDINSRIEHLKSFVPQINSWGICDCCCSCYKFTVENREEVWNLINSYINGTEYEVRFAVVMMMNYYLNDEYIDRVFEIYASINREEYYINMAVAWALSVAFVKYREKTESLFSSNALSPWVQNKAVQKIRESNRVDKKTKEYIKKYKIA